jgi:hypothetical protein
MEAEENVVSGDQNFGHGAVPLAAGTHQQSPQVGYVSARTIDVAASKEIVRSMCEKRSQLSN